MKICTCLEKQTKVQKKVSVSIGVWKTYFYDHKCDCEFECVGWRILHNCFYTNMYKQMPCFYLVRMIILYFIEHIYWCVCKRVCKLACMCECMWDLENEREKNVCNHFVHGFWKREEKRKKKVIGEGSWKLHGQHSAEGLVEVFTLFFCHWCCVALSLSSDWTVKSQVIGCWNLILCV